MNCPKCSRPVPDEANFCSYCGAPLRTPDEAVTPEPVPAPETVPEQEPVPAPESAPAEEPIPEEAPVPEEEPVSEEEPIPEEEPVPEEEPILEEEPIPEEEPVPEEEYAAPEPAPYIPTPVPPRPEPTPRRQNRSVPQGQRRTAPAVSPERRAQPVQQKKRKRTGAIVALVIALVLVALLAAGAAVWFLYLKPPVFMTMEELGQLVPPGATVTATKAEGKVQTADYFYTESFVYCDVTTTVRTTFRYGQDGWVADPTLETLGVEEDWSRLAGTWTEPPERSTGTDLTIELTGVTDGVPAGTVSYTEDGSTHRGTFGAFFQGGTESAEDGSYRFEGQDAFPTAYLIIDRGMGLYFNNDQYPMEKDAPKREPEPTPLPPDGLEIQGGETDESADAQPQERKLIATAVLNVRPGPNTDQSPLGTVEIGTVLDYTELTNGWYQVSYQNATGYVKADYVQDLADTSIQSVCVLSAKSELNVRPDPSTAGEPLETLKAGDRMVSVSLDNGWYKIRYNSGFGYVSADYVTVAQTVQ